MTYRNQSISATDDVRSKVAHVMNL